MTAIALMGGTSFSPSGESCNWVRHGRGIKADGLTLSSGTHKIEQTGATSEPRRCFDRGICCSRLFWFRFPEMAV